MDHGGGGTVCSIFTVNKRGCRCGNSDVGAGASRKHLSRWCDSKSPRRINDRVWNREGQKQGRINPPRRRRRPQNSKPEKTLSTGLNPSVIKPDLQELVSTLIWETYMWISVFGFRINPRVNVLIVIPFIPKNRKILEEQEKNFDNHGNMRK